MKLIEQMTDRELLQLLDDGNRALMVEKVKRLRTTIEDRITEAHAEILKRKK